MINCLVAVEKSSQGIGYNGSMPWPHLKGDMEWFKNSTKGHIVIMGSTTWNSLPKKPLPDRINVVLSRTHHWLEADHTFSDPEIAITFCQLEYPDKEIYIIGGQEIYNSTRYLVDNFYITEIDESYVCDKFFDMNYIKKTCGKEQVLLKFDKTETTPAYIIKEYRR